MKWFLNLSTRNKLFLGFGLMIVCLAAAIATAYQGIATIREAQDHVYKEDLASVRDLLTLRAIQNRVRAEMLEVQMLPKHSGQERLLKDISERAKQIGSIMDELLGRAKNDPHQLSRLEELQSVQKAFAQTKDDEIIPLILAGKIAEAQRLALGIQQERHEKMRAIADELSKTAEEDARIAMAESDLKVQQAVHLFIIVGIAAILLAVAMALLISRVIAVPLQMISGIGEHQAGQRAERVRHQAVAAQSLHELRQKLQQLAVQYKA